MNRKNSHTPPGQSKSPTSQSYGIQPAPFLPPQKSCPRKITMLVMPFCKKNSLFFYDKGRLQKKTFTQWLNGQLLAAIFHRVLKYSNGLNLHVGGGKGGYPTKNISPSISYPQHIFAR